MVFSKHNIISQIKDSENFFIINPLSKNADILSKNEINQIRDGGIPANEELIKKGYLVNEDEEKRKFKMAYLDFLDERDKSETQIFFVTNYTCNFACSYCYQEGYEKTHTSLNNEIIDSFFKYVKDEFAGRDKYITVFGGEPLLPGEKSKKNINYFIEQANSHNLDLAIVTNGYTLKEYVPILSKGKIREIQVTLDGTQEVHDKRRFLKGGGPSFHKIIEGIDYALKSGLNINLRVIIDKENISNLPDFADFAIQQGWTKNPLFKTQLGRNYELHFCQDEQNKLFKRAEMYASIYELIKKHPHILEFHRPAFSIANFLFEHGEMPDPLFDSCPACKTEWAFDFTGKIYPCTATVGKSDEVLGTFFPERKINQEKIDPWEERDVTSVNECSNCSLQLACGGGCAAVAKNQSGNIQSPDCRPVKELLEMGIGLYFNKEN